MVGLRKLRIVMFSSGKLELYVLLDGDAMLMPLAKGQPAPSGVYAALAVSAPANNEAKGIKTKIASSMTTFRIKRTLPLFNSRQASFSSTQGTKRSAAGTHDAITQTCAETLKFVLLFPETQSLH